MHIIFVIMLVLLVAQITTALTGKYELSMLLCAAVVGMGGVGLLILSISG